MTKADLVELIAGRFLLPRERADEAVCEVFEAMIRALRGGDGVEIRGFGTFRMRQYGAYLGRNPRTGASVGVLPKRKPFFRAGKELAQRLMGKMALSRVQSGSAEGIGSRRL